MSLLGKIKCIDTDAAKILEEKNLINDGTIKSLTPEDLHKLFPGHKRVKLRLAVMDLIGPKKQVDTCLKKLKDSIEPKSFRAALSNNDVLDDYLNILRGMKNQMDHVQSFLDAHIDFLEEIREEKPGESSYKEAEGSDMQTGEVGTTSEPSCPHPSGERPLPQMQAAQGASQPSQNLVPASETRKIQSGVMPMLTENGEVGMTSEPSSPNPSGWRPLPQMPAAQDSLPDMEMHDTSGRPVPQPEEAKREVGMTSEPSSPNPSGRRPLPQMPAAQVTYQIVVGGKTFNAHQQLMDKLKKKVPLVEFDKTKQNHEITILFCPISTRIGLDVKAAMDEVKDNKPIILVLMHHYPEPRYLSNRKTWEDYPNIELFVSVFYHDSVSGLIKCEENDKAIHQMKEKLAEIYNKNNPETSQTDEQTSVKQMFKYLFQVKK